MIRREAIGEVMDASLVALARHHHGRVVTLHARLAAHATKAGDHRHCVTVIAK